LLAGRPAKVKIQAGLRVTYGMLASTPAGALG